MDYLVRTNYTRFWFALAASLLLHLAVLALKTSAPVSQPNKTSGRAASRLDITLKAQPEQKPQEKKTQPQHKIDQRPRVLAMQPKRDTTPSELVPRTWTRAERDDMNQFMNEITEEARPPSGAVLAQRALTMARNMHSPEPDEDAESKQIMRKLMDANVDPFSIEMYFDALFRKMNRSATMIGNEKRHMGLSTAAVRILLNKDGSVRSFKILRAADQQAEIDFIQAVVDQSAPFPMFPPDIGKATDAVALLICIRPGLSGDSSGATFSRMGGGQACR